MASSIMCLTFVSLILTCLYGVNGYPPNHKIRRLPGQPTVMFQQFSGYVDVGVGRALFYYFVESENQPDSKPLALWLNGGPGCSSVGFGAFIEHGPFQPTEDGLIENEYSWNTVANMLYLESPAGVGFSFSSNTSFYDYVDDQMAAQDNLVFLEHWLDLFPAYKGRDLLISSNTCKKEKLV